MKLTSEIAVLRTELRDVNVKYSALVRTGDGEGRVASLRALHMQRHALMARISEASNGCGRPAVRNVSRWWHSSQPDRPRGTPVAI